MMYDDRITIKVGSVANLERKMLRAAKALSAEDERNPAAVGTLDLTIDPYAYFREGKTTQAPVSVPAPAETVSAPQGAVVEAPAQ